ncbi:MAG TPA: PHP domain-containing protein [Gemmatimonadales bacterium]|nr:PHP domain-containing protein [Gemmatimonadales bacterium]
MSLSNAHIAELLAVASKTAPYPVLQKALRRASRRAFMWPEEAARVRAEGRALTELAGVGPHLARIIGEWLDAPPEIPEPAPLRAGFLTTPEARAILARDPSWARALRGDLQTHSDWSDGTGTIAEMAEAAAQHGYEFLAITDHAQSLKIAGGIDARALRRQATEIAKVNAELERRGERLRLLRSIELNLNPQGEGDMPRRALAGLDLVLGCFHSALRRKDDQTERYLAALRNPDVHIVGHPRGRIYNFRAGLAADWPRVFATAAELDKAVEIDAYPDRQDLSPDLVRLASREGCRISIGTDAHGPSQLAFIELGLASALQAGVARDRILNFLTREELLSWVSGIRDA